jgi:hypothetical protein
VGPGRVEVYSSNPQDRRELVLWLWHPAAPDPDADRAVYLPEAWAPAGQLLGLDAAGLRSHAVAGAAVAEEQASYPVLVLSPSGFGHSFGGNAALQWCRDDRRCRAAANLDGALWTEVGRVGLDRPVQVLAKHPEFAPSGAEAVAAGMASDAEAYETEKAITFDGWQTVQQRAPPEQPFTQLPPEPRQRRRPQGRRHRRGLLAPQVFTRRVDDAGWLLDDYKRWVLDLIQHAILLGYPAPAATIPPTAAAPSVSVCRLRSVRNPPIRQSSTAVGSGISCWAVIRTEDRSHPWAATNRSRASSPS